MSWQCFGPFSYWLLLSINCSALFGPLFSLNCILYQAKNKTRRTDVRIVDNRHVTALKSRHVAAASDIGTPSVSTYLNLKVQAGRVGGARWQCYFPCRVVWKAPHGRRSDAMDRSSENDTI